MNISILGYNVVLKGRHTSEYCVLFVDRGAHIPGISSAGRLIFVGFELYS
jgi:hypothetical protein